jgi:hypothetical protein
VPDLPPHAEALLPKVAEDGAAGAVGSLLTGGGVKQGAEEGALTPLLIAHAQDPSAGYFGTNPATPAFGGHDFTANLVPGEPSSFSLPYFMTFKAHSSYWTRNSASLINMGYIVDGQYNLVTLAPGPPAGSGG